MLLGVYYTLSDLSKVDDGDLTVTFGEWYFQFVPYCNFLSVFLYPAQTNRIPPFPYDASIISETEG